MVPPTLVTTSTSEHPTFLLAQTPFGVEGLNVGEVKSSAGQNAGLTEKHDSNRREI